MSESLTMAKALNRGLRRALQAVAERRDPGEPADAPLP